MITRQTTREELLKRKETDPKKGRGCQFGSGFILPEEIPKLAKAKGMGVEEWKKQYLDEVEVFHTKAFVLKTLKGEKPYGPCIFLNQENGECTIHKTKPLYCSLTNGEEPGEVIQWFQLTEYVNPGDPSSLREWHAYCEGVKVIPGGRPEEIVGKKRMQEILEYKDLKKDD
jgi:Fe-S-cluster containining protein